MLDTIGKRSRGISDHIIITVICIAAATFLCIFYYGYSFYLNRTEKSDTTGPIFDVEHPPIKKEAETISVAPPKSVPDKNCIFKPVLTLSDEERSWVLDNAKSKIVSIFEGRESFMECFMTICSSPMTLTEAEVLGDYFLEQKRPNLADAGFLKIAIYWNCDVASACLRAKRYAESMFYNSSWEVGKRSQVVLGGHINDLSDDGLYQGLLASDLFFIWVKPVSYDKSTQTLYLETDVQCMMELIFNTFEGLGLTIRGCYFNRLPNLKYVKITYKDQNGQAIGKGVYGFRYWEGLIQRSVVPKEVDDNHWEEFDRLYLRRKSKVISDQEYYRLLTLLDNEYNQIQQHYYQERWVELFPLIEEFLLSRELPLVSEDFRF